MYIQIGTPKIYTDSLYKYRDTHTFYTAIKSLSVVIQVYVCALYCIQALVCTKKGIHIDFILYM